MSPPRIQAIGGLCNRVQAILSWRAVHGSVAIAWEKDVAISGAHFLDVFEPIDGVQFIDGGAPDAWDVHSEAPATWEQSYALLVPKPLLRARINALRWTLGRYIAVHIRRTDMTELLARDGQRVIPDSDFIRWIAARPDPPVFVATDNGETQRTLKEAFPLRHLFFSTSLDGSATQSILDQHRNGALSDAVVDLFCAGYSAEFMGTHYSSFSKTIERLRRLPR